MPEGRKRRVPRGDNVVPRTPKAEGEGEVQRRVVRAARAWHENSASQDAQARGGDHAESRALEP